ncbi:MAG: signal peptidase I [Eubacterium sp.]|nr:signal peptidase I [Eubacterium sp.]
MFTTIDEPIEWKLNENNSSKNVNIPEPEIIEDLPPVSYLEGASADGYQVENVAFGDISVGVETESVEFSVGHPLLRLLRNILICVAAALILSLLVTKFIAHHTTVDGSSMMPTLSDGDQLIVQQLSYYFHDPERFDVIVFPISTEDNYIKRVIGLPGETVQIIDGQVYINGNLLTDDRYGSERIQDPGNAADTIYLQADEYFVLGDNRNASVDSRFSEVGVIKRKDIKAKAWLRFYPFGSFGTVN